MSAESFIAYVGLRFEVALDEVEAVELRTDQRMVAARSVGLRCYWGASGNAEKRYLLIIGSELGVFGHEGSYEAEFSMNQVEELSRATQTKLEAAGLEGVAALHLVWEPDL